MGTPEGRIKAKLKRELDKLPNVYRFMPVQNGMGAPTLDFLLCVNCRFVGIETKAPGKKPTARQQLTIDRMLAAGADVHVVSDAVTLDYCIRSLKALIALPDLGSKWEI